MAVTHISEAEAARDFKAIAARVRAGESICIDGEEVLELKVVSKPQPRKTLTEAIRRARERALDVTLDDQFGRDLEQVIRNHELEGRRDPWAE